MWNIQQQKESYQHATRINQIGPQTTRDTPKYGQLNDRSICKLVHETKTFKSIRYEMVLVAIQGGV